MKPQDKDLPLLVSPKQLLELVPALKAGGLRAMLFRSRANGLEESGAVIRLNRKLVIDARKFVEWLKEGSRA